MSPCHFASPALRALCADLAPTLARIPRERPVNLNTLRFKTPKEGPSDYGASSVHARLWLDLPRATRPTVTEYAAQHRLSQNSLFSQIAAERRLRLAAQPHRARARLEAAAHQYLSTHPTTSTDTLGAYARAHGYTPRLFALAVRRVALLRAYDAWPSSSLSRAA